MKIPHEFLVPDEDQLIQFFGGDPVERAIEDGYWCYEVVGSAGTSLRFSLNLYERSIQTAVCIGPVSVVTVSHELATRLSVDERELRCEFACADCSTALTVHRAEAYRLVWATLRTK